MPRWFWGAVSAIIYLELALLVVLKVKLPEPPAPVFQEPTIEYQWTKGPYDDDWDFCWRDDTTGQHRCWEEDI